MFSQSASLLFFPMWISLCTLIFFPENGTARCLFTHRDSHCVASGYLPLPLKCSFPGKWFTVKSVSKQTAQGDWEEVTTAKSIAQAHCKSSRIVNPGARGSQCTVGGILPEIRTADVIRVEYYCWEINPDLLGGFGRRSNIFRQLKRVQNI